jgi:hypothetical protein
MPPNYSALLGLWLAVFEQAASKYFEQNLALIFISWDPQNILNKI